MATYGDRPVWIEKDSVHGQLPLTAKSGSAKIIKIAEFDGNIVCDPSTYGDQQNNLKVLKEGKVEELYYDAKDDSLYIWRIIAYDDLGEPLIFANESMSRLRHRNPDYYSIRRLLYGTFRE